MKTKIILFKLMMIFMSLIPVNAWGWYISEVIRINPGDTVLSSQLTERTHEMDNGSHILHKDLVVIKNGGDFVLKIDSLNPMSYPADENNCIVVSGTHRLLFTFEKLNGQEFTLDVVIAYRGVPFLDGIELQPHQRVIINNDEDAKKTISFSQDGKNYFESNLWFMSLTPQLDFNDGDEVASNLYTTTLGDIMEVAKRHLGEHIDSVNIQLSFFTENGLILWAPPEGEIGVWIAPPAEDTGLYLFAENQKALTTVSKFTFTIKDTRPTTGIHNASIDEAQKEPVIFDLQGRRVRDPQPGLIYIINGKKVICR